MSQTCRFPCHVPSFLRHHPGYHSLTESTPVPPKNCSHPSPKRGMDSLRPVERHGDGRSCRGRRQASSPSQVGGLGEGQGSPRPQRVLHPLLPIDPLLPIGGELPPGGLQYWYGYWVDTGILGSAGLQVPLTPEGYPSSLSRESGAAPPWTSGLSSKHVRVGQFHFDFWLFPFTSFLCSNTLTPTASERKAKGS